jgi:hypothetical protein
MVQGTSSESPAFKYWKKRQKMKLANQATHPGLQAMRIIAEIADPDWGCTTEQISIKIKLAETELR